MTSFQEDRATEPDWANKDTGMGTGSLRNVSSALTSEIRLKRKVNNGGAFSTVLRHA